jgi:hypothetical protein
MTDAAHALDALERKYLKTSAGSLKEMLQRAESKMVPSLRKHLKVMFRYFQLINLAGMASADAPYTESRYVCSNLLARIANDLLALQSLAAAGLADQTATVATSTYECAVTICAIGEDGDMARKWLDCADPAESLSSVKKLSKLAEEKIGIELGLYSLYSKLCGVKHSSPAIQRHSGQDICLKHEECTAQYFFPTGSEREQFVSATSIEIALMVTNFALTSFIQTHVGEGQRAELSLGLEKLNTELEEIAADRIAEKTAHQT